MVRRVLWQSSGGQQASGSKQSKGGQFSGKQEESDLKSREYTGLDGQVHHHTRTYEGQHKR